MTSKAQKEANSRYRAKLAESGLVRLEVIVPKKDREIVKALADSLSAGVARDADNPRPLTGAAIWKALRSAPSPLDELQFDRAEHQLRAIDL
jgi:hypothetical protein